MQSGKRQLRDEMRRRLAELSDGERAEWSARIAAGVFALAAWRDARVVMCFLSLPGEVQTRPIIERAWAEGKRIVVPKVDWADKRMWVVPLDSWSTPMRTGPLGLSEVVGGEPADVGTIDLLLTPGLAFDLLGGRLGRGGGFFDRFLADPAFAGVSCGLAFGCQRVVRVPAGPTDMGIDLLVTESGAFPFTGRGRQAAG